MVQGKCQCGEVRYQAAGEITDLSHCHCSMCRKLHGAAFVTFAGVSRESFEWTRGDAALQTYASSDAIDRFFCGNCGSQLGCTYKPEPDLIYLAMGTVDGNPASPPAYHQFAASKAPWFEITDGLPQHATWPEESS
jgi:hypothetical protein